MPKLTETTNDMLKSGTLKLDPLPGGQKNGSLHVIPPHEPLTGEQWIPPNLKPQTVTANILGEVPTPEAKKPLKIALIGTAPSSRMLAPYSDPSWTIWGCSPGNMKVLPRADAWFEIHGSLLWPENRHYGEPYIEWLRNLTIPVYMQDKRYIPNATPLPIDELIQEFGPYYFTSSFAWMLAMAMKLGASEIALYGIDMASRDEYILQRPGAYYFFIEAKKRGIKVFAPYESDIMQPPGLYGFSEVTPFGRKLIARMQELKERSAALGNQIAQLTSQKTYLDGAMEDLDYVTSIWGGVQNNSRLEKP